LAAKAHGVSPVQDVVAAWLAVAWEQKILSIKTIFILLKRREPVFFPIRKSKKLNPWAKTNIDIVYILVGVSFLQKMFWSPLGHWALEHVPRILDRLAECPEDSDSPTCPGRWLVFTSPGVAPVIYTVTEDDVIRYSNPNNGYLWWGPLPEIDPESVNDGIDSPPPETGAFDDI
jgi:hypothetical protein